MNVLVLGGSRFLGLHLVYGLAEQGHNVWVLNRGISPAEFPPGVKRLRADRFDPVAMQAAVDGLYFDAVFDISGFTAKEVGIAAETLKSRVGHLLFCSSTGVYAPSNVLPIHEASPLLRDPAGRKYGLEKVACEEYLAQASREHGFQVTFIRPPNIYGPHNIVPQRELAHFARLEQRRPILLPAYGLPLVPLAYVADVVQAFLRASGNPVAYGEAFTIASSQVVTLQGWVLLMAEIVGVEPHIVYPPPELEKYVEWSPMMPVPPTSWPFEWRRIQLYTVEKAQKILGYAPTPLRKGLEETYRWYRQQPQGRWRWNFCRDDECLRKMGIM